MTKGHLKINKIQFYQSNPYPILNPYVAFLYTVLTLIISGNDTKAKSARKECELNTKETSKLREMTTSTIRQKHFLFHSHLCLLPSYLMKCRK